jgi:hypothetical protein
MVVTVHLGGMHRHLGRLGVLIFTVIGLVLAPRSTQALTAEDLGAIINEADPLSVRIGEHYVCARQMPTQNIIRIRTERLDTTVPVKEFVALKPDVDKRTLVNVQAHALTCVQPYRVEWSITSAFAFGFNRANCGEGCASTRLNACRRAPHIRV